MFVFAYAACVISHLSLAFYFCFFTGGGPTSLSSPSEVILSISLFLMLKTSTSPPTCTGNSVVLKSRLHVFILHVIVLSTCWRSWWRRNSVSPYVPTERRCRYFSNETPNNVSMECHQDISVVGLHD